MGPASHDGLCPQVTPRVLLGPQGAIVPKGELGGGFTVPMLYEEPPARSPGSRASLPRASLVDKLHSQPTYSPSLEVDRGPVEVSCLISRCSMSPETSSALESRLFSEYQYDIRREIEPGFFCFFPLKSPL